MLTRARARATNQPIFVDDKWNDAYIQTKDEQIEMLHMQHMLKSWDNEEDSELEELDDKEEGEGASEDRWISEDDDSEHEDDDVDDLEDRTASATKQQQQQQQEADLSNGRIGAWVAGGGWFKNVVWTAATATVAPLALYVFVARCLGRRRKRRVWPLQSSSLTQSLVKMATNVLVVIVLLLLLSSRLCGEEFTVPTVASLLQLPSTVSEMPTCAMVMVDDWRRLLASESNATLLFLSVAVRELVLESLAAALLVVSLLQFHRLWLKKLVLVATLSSMSYRFVVDTRTAQRVAIEISTLDPTFAFANESIFIAVDGQNLQEGATIAWVPYWNGLQQHKAAELDKLFAQPLRNGGVAVVFDQLNEFVPCYAATDSAFTCFARLRLRVKDAKSVPGWSLHQAQEL